MGKIYNDLMTGLADEPRVIERDQDVIQLREGARKLHTGMRRRSGRDPAPQHMVSGAQFRAPKLTMC